MKRIIVGISGASGVVMGYHLLKALNNFPDIETHLVVTEGALTTWKHETKIPIETLESLASQVYNNSEIDALIASGSFVTDGIIILPCSMKTLSGISNGYASGLLIRAVDVCLKENRKVVLCPRETPLGKVHLRNLLTASDLGCQIVPPMLTFYNESLTLDEQIQHIVGKILMQFNLSIPNFRPWKGGS